MPSLRPSSLAVQPLPLGTETVTKPPSVTKCVTKSSNAERPPIGEKAMTNAEKQRRYRERKRLSKAGK
jgi:hypothetical protein